jgi:hypothetical protein
MFHGGIVANGRNSAANSSIQHVCHPCLCQLLADFDCSQLRIAQRPVVLPRLDSIGDCVVVLTILAAQNGLQIEDCIAQAYDEIKERKGVMKDGVFVKEEDAQ